MSIKGGPTPNGKIHSKFPFWLMEPFPNKPCFQLISPMELFNCYHKCSNKIEIRSETFELYAAKNEPSVPS